MEHNVCMWKSGFTRTEKLTIFDCIAYVYISGGVYSEFWLRVGLACYRLMTTATSFGFYSFLYARALTRFMSYLINYNWLERRVGRLIMRDTSPYICNPFHSIRFDSIRFVLILNLSHAILGNVRSIFRCDAITAKNTEINAIQRNCNQKLFKVV